MPAVISHYLLAQRVFDALAENEPTLRLNHTAFLWGAYGPDIFFAHRVMPWQKGKSLSYLSKKMHGTNAEKILNYLMSYARTNESIIAESYAFGFATHYAFDSTAHPFVNYFASAMAEKNPSVHRSVYHNEIESSLDTIFLKYEKDIQVTDFKLQQTAPLDKDVMTVIADVLHKYFLSYGAGNIPIQDIVQAQHDWHSSLVLLTDRSTLKKSAVRLGEKLMHLSPILSPIIRTPHPNLSCDYANLKHTEWYAANDKSTVHNESFFELADISEKLSLKLISEMVSGKRLTNKHCVLSFSG